MGKHKTTICIYINSVIRTLGIRGGLHTACSLAERVREVDVSFSHDGLVESRKLTDHLWHGLLQQVLLFALLYVLFTKHTTEFQHSCCWSCSILVMTAVYTVAKDIFSQKFFWFVFETFLGLLGLLLKVFIKTKNVFFVRWKLLFFTVYDTKAKDTRSSH